MSKINILVFPCGSEIGLEVYRSLKFSSHFRLIGASSIDDHGKFEYDTYLSDVPFIDDPACIPYIAQLVRQYSITALYPSMDSVIAKLKLHEAELGCTVISSAAKTTLLCLSKSKTYDALKHVIKTPARYITPKDVPEFPVFSKPDIGYGSRGAVKITDQQQLDWHVQHHPDTLLLEYLPGDEFTVDCFTNREGQLLFAGPRQRKRISNGISVNTSTRVPDSDTLHDLATKINQEISFRGAWFFQVKQNSAGAYVLLEIAARLAGSSSVYRMQGINFAMLSVFDALDMPVAVTPNTYEVECDRALGQKYKLNIDFDTAYVDLDDTLIVEGKINTILISLLFQFINKRKKIILITRHANVVKDTLLEYRIERLFDQVIHLKEGEDKADFITEPNAIFIDDSFRERSKVFEKLSIPVFAPDAVECLLE